jgi:hypothetical protein
MSDLEYYLNGDYGDVKYNGKTVAIVELDTIEQFRRSEDSVVLFRKLRQFIGGSFTTFVFFISKKDFNISVVMVNEPGEKIKFFSYKTGYKMSLLELFERFPELQENNVDLFEVGGFPNVKETIKRFCNNDPNVTAKDVMDVEPLIYRIKEQKSKRRSLVTLRFDSNSHYWRMFNYDENNIQTMENIFSSYGGDISNSYENVSNDWDEGYFIYNFSPENRVKIKEILSYVNPTLGEKFDLNQPDEREGKEILEFLEDKFYKQSRNIRDKWSQLNEEAWQEQFEKDITEENADYFEQFFIYKKSDFYEYITTMNKILELYDSVPNSEYMSLYELLSMLAEDLNTTSDWMENLYSYGTQAFGFNQRVFNEYTAEELDDIKDSIEDDWNFVDRNEYIKILKYLDDKNFYMNMQITHPTKKDRSFTVQGINPETNKILLTTYSGNDKARQEWTLEEFNNYLYHPELFESRKFGKRKI